MTEKSVMTAEQYNAKRDAERAQQIAEKEAEAAVARAAAAAEEERQAAIVRKSNEQTHAEIAARHAAAAKAAAAARAVVATLPSWIEAKAIGWDHKGAQIEVESGDEPHPLADGKVLLRLTRRAPRPTPGTTGIVDMTAAAMNKQVQILAPGESRWLALGGLLKVPQGKSVVVWCLHRPAKVAYTDQDLSKGYVLDSPRQYGPGYVGEITVNFANAPEPGRNIQINLGSFLAIAELVDQ